MRIDTMAPTASDAYAKRDYLMRQARRCRTTADTRTDDGERAAYLRRATEYVQTARAWNMTARGPAARHAGRSF